MHRWLARLAIAAPIIGCRDAPTAPCPAPGSTTPTAVIEFARALKGDPFLLGVATSLGQPALATQVYRSISALDGSKVDPIGFASTMADTRASISSSLGIAEPASADEPVLSAVLQLTLDRIADVGTGVDSTTAPTPAP